MLFFPFTLQLSSWVNIAGTLLGVPKAMAALLSGEVSTPLSLFCFSFFRAMTEFCADARYSGA
jgi:hypothetical protein